VTLPVPGVHFSHTGFTQLSIGWLGPITPPITSLYGDILFDTDGVPYFFVGATIALDTDGVPYIAGPSPEIGYDTDGVPYLTF